MKEFLVSHETYQSNVIAFNTVDKRKCDLHGEVRVQSLGGGLSLVYFHKSKV